MTEELRADLELSLEAALRSIAGLRDDIEEALRGAAGSFEEEFARITGALPPVELEADAAAVAPAIEEAVSAADSVVPVEGAGFEQLTLGIDDAIDSATPVVVIEADISAAESAIEDLADTASGTSGAVGGLTSGLGSGGLTGAAGLAQGSVTGLGTAVGHMGGGMGAAVPVVGAIGGAVGLMFNQAVDAAGAVYRLDRSMGELSSRIERIRVGDLNVDLSKLALQLGSDDDNMRQTAASAFEMATAFGKGREASADYAAGLLAIASRAVALNPQLGDVGDTASNLLRALQSGRERALIPFQLGLSGTAINAKAMEIALAEGRTEVNASDRAFAGVTLASEKFGHSLKEDIAKGAENPTLKLRSLKQTVQENIEALGTPIIAPIFEVMEDAIPVTEDVGRVIAALAQGALPVLISALQVAGPILEVVATATEAIPGPLLAAGAAMLLFHGPLTKGTRLLALFGNEGLTTGDKIGRGIVAVGLFASAVDGLDGSTTQATVSIGEMAASGFILGSTMGAAKGGIFAAGAASYGLTTALLHATLGGRDLDKQLSELEASAKGLAHVTDAELRPAFKSVQAAAREADTLGASGLVNTLRAFREVAEDDLGTAARLREQFVGNATVYKGMGQIIDKVAASTRQQGEDQEAASKIVAAAGSAYDRASVAADTYRTALEQLDAGHTSAFQAETQLATATLGLEAAFLEAKGSTDKYTESGQANREALAGAANDARTYSAAILEAGGSTEAARAPLVGLATQVTDLATRFGAAPADVASLLSSLGLLSFASPEVQAQAAAMGLSVESIGTSSQTAAALTADGMASAKGAIDGAGLPAAAGAQGRGVVDEFGNPVSTGIPKVTGDALTAAGGALDKGDLKDSARQAGHAVGRAFGEGMEGGIYAREGDVDSAARYIVRSAEAAARDEADSRSPSMVWDAIGQDLTAGMAGGMETGAADVIRAAEDIVRAAASASVPPPGALPGGVGPDASEIGREVARALVAAGVGTGNGLTIGSAQFGDRGVLSDLDYFWRTRMAGG